MDKPINAQGRHGRIKVRNREQMSKSVRRAVVGGCGGRVPLIKLNFNHRQRHTQIPDSQSANLRQMILLSFPATLGVGTAQILIKKKEACKLFPSCFKDLNNWKEKDMCLHVVFLCCCLGSVSLSWVDGSANNIGDLQLSAHVQLTETRDTKGCHLSFSWINKALQASFKPGGMHYALFEAAFWSKLLGGSFFSSPLHPPPHATLPASHIPQSTPPTPPNHVCLAVANHWWSPDCQR